MIRKLLIVTLLLASLAAAPRVEAQIQGGQMFQRFIADLNQGNVSAALALTGPTFTVTLPDGSSAMGANAAPLLASLPTPLTIVTLSTANRAGQGTLQTPSGGSVSVNFTGANGKFATLTFSGSLGGTPRGTAPSGGGAAAGTAMYPAGWALIAAPAGTNLSGVQGPLYTLQPGDTGYQTVQPSAGTTTGFGYWAYFSAATTVTLAPGSGAPYSVRAPAGQFIMAGNPSGSLPARVSGADVAYTYDAAQGYQQTTQLNPGQGALVLSNAGGTITVAPPTP